MRTADDPARRRRSSGSGVPAPRAGSRCRSALVTDAWLCGRQAASSRCSLSSSKTKTGNRADRRRHVAASHVRRADPVAERCRLRHAAAHVAESVSPPSSGVVAVAEDQEGVAQVVLHLALVVPQRGADRRTATARRATTAAPTASDDRDCDRAARPRPRSRSSPADAGKARRPWTNGRKSLIRLVRRNAICPDRP